MSRAAPRTIPNAPPPRGRLLQVAAAERRRLADSLREFGFGALGGAIRTDALLAMRREAEEKYGAAHFAEQREAELSYRANITDLSPTAERLLTDPGALELLTELFGQRFRLSTQISCLTFYGDGDHLGAHLDQPAEDCAVTIIIYLLARSPAPDAPDTGLVLNVYGEERASVGAARLRIPTRAGDIVLGRGSRIWHERPRLKPGEHVAAITGCYALAA